MEGEIGGVGGNENVERRERSEKSNEQDTEMVDKEVIVSENAAPELVSEEAADASRDLGGDEIGVAPENVRMRDETGVTRENERMRDETGVTPENEGMRDETGVTPENVRMQAVDYTEVTPERGHMERENKDVSQCADDVRLEFTEKDASDDPGQVEHGSKKKRKGKVVSKVTSSWSLRSRTKDKPKAPEPTEAVEEGEPEALEPTEAVEEGSPKALEPTEAVEESSGSGKSKRRGRKRKRVKQTNTDSKTNEFSKIRKKLTYFLQRIKYEQSLIDAYSSEGWKGQSLDKLKPEKELQRAKSHIVNYKLKIRELFQQLDSLLEVGKLPESLFDDQGEIDSEDIFCAKCGSKDLPLDNDIILCDGACERGFHQLCLDPPLLNEDIPPGDEDWFCPGCDCKDDCLDVLNELQGTNICILDNWEKIFPEAVEAASGTKLDDCSSSDEDDDDYDPNKPVAIEKVERKSGSDDSGYFSAPEELAAPNNEDYMGLPSEDSEDDDFDPEHSDPDKEVKQSSSSSDFTSDSEDFGALLDDASAPGDDTEDATREQGDLKVGRRKRPSLKDELSHLMENSDEQVSGRRQVKRLDYKRLYDEEYGNTSSDSSDEDFNDTKAPKRQKVSNRKTEVISPKKPEITENEVDAAVEHNEISPQLPKRTRKSKANGGTSPTLNTGGSSSDSTKRSRKSNGGVSATPDTIGSANGSSKKSRLGEAVTQRLYESFRENQYPERAVKEQLANELGLSIQQVAKWFENARWSSNHRQRMESGIKEKTLSPCTTKSSSDKAVEVQEAATTTTEKHEAEKTAETSLAKTSADT